MVHTRGMSGNERVGRGGILAAVVPGQPVAVLEHPASGRRMELATDQPGLQVYTGGYLSEKIVGKGGRPYCRFAGLPSI